ncbi:MAG: hypothetical protein D6798_16045, partial [Deltaproteobacteria bacterium]
FIEQLQAKELPFGGFLVNRVIEPPRADLDPVALPSHGPLPPDRWRAVLATLFQAAELRRRQAADHAAAIRALREAGPPDAPCWSIPDQARDLHDLRGLASLGPYLPDVGVV